MIAIGVDEAGRGPVIGPLVVCSVAIPRDDCKMLTDRGVKDSKDLSASKREEIRQWFLRECEERDWYYSIVYCETPEIDLAVQKNGLNILETKLFAESVNNLRLESKQNVQIICDACDIDTLRFNKRVAQLIDKWPWQQSKIDSYHKADENYPVVGMASILAKQARDEAIKSIEKAVGFEIGSGYPSDQITINAVRKMIEDVPHEALRWSWSTVKRIWSENNSAEMPSRLVTSGRQRTLF